GRVGAGVLDRDRVDRAVREAGGRERRRRVRGDRLRQVEVGGDRYAEARGRRVVGGGGSRGRRGGGGGGRERRVGRGGGGGGRDRRGGVRCQVAEIAVHCCRAGALARCDRDVAVVGAESVVERHCGRGRGAGVAHREVEGDLAAARHDRLVDRLRDGEVGQRDARPGIGRRVVRGVAVAAARDRRRVLDRRRDRVVDHGRDEDRSIRGA